MHLNQNKCKELRISFTSNPKELHAVVVEVKELEVVSSNKLFGLPVSDNLRWNAHVNDLINKAILLSRAEKGTIVASIFSSFFVQRVYALRLAMQYQYSIMPCHSIYLISLCVSKRGRYRLL